MLSLARPITDFSAERGYFEQRMPFKILVFETTVRVGRRSIHGENRFIVSLGLLSLSFLVHTHELVRIYILVKAWVSDSGGFSLCFLLLVAFVAAIAPED